MSFAVVMYSPSQPMSHPGGQHCLLPFTASIYILLKVFVQQESLDGSVHSAWMNQQVPAHPWQPVLTRLCPPGTSGEQPHWVCWLQAQWAQCARGGEFRSVLRCGCLLWASSTDSRCLSQGAGRNAHRSCFPPSAREEEKSPVTYNCI